MKQKLLITLLILPMLVLSQASMVKDLNPTGDGVTGKIISINNKIIFNGYENITTGNELYESNGTTSGTVLLKNISLANQSSGNPNKFYKWNNTTVFFEANDAANQGNAELWKTDGTTAGTVLVKDIFVNGASIPRSFYAWNNKVYFAARPANSIGWELFETDGTASGTNIVSNISTPSQSSGEPEKFFAFNNELFFSAYQQGNGREPWKTDGTNVGTTMLYNCYPASPSGDPSGFIEYNNEMFFSARDATNGFELWKSDGTTAGTLHDTDLNPGNANSYPNNFTLYNSNLFMVATTSIFGREIMYRNASGTMLLLDDINPGNSSSNPDNLFLFNGVLYFSANDGVNGTEIWRSNGTQSGTYMLFNINSTGDSNPSKFIEYNNKLYFTATSSSGIELWRTDGSILGTQQVADINPTGDSDPSSMVVYNYALYFHADDGINGRELWKYFDTALLSNNDSALADVKLYPNPTYNNFTIESAEILKNLDIISITGDRVKVLNPKNKTHNIEELSSGIYFIIASTETKSQTIKLIKK